MTTTYDAPEVELSLTLAELQTLQKTVGIAVDNVGRKVQRERGPIRDAALADYKNLQSINAEISAILAEEIK